MDAPATPPPGGFDLERPAPPSPPRWMARGDDGRSAAPSWEVLCGEGMAAAQRAVGELRARFGATPGARIELHLEKRCGHLHLHGLLVCAHDGVWAPYLCPFDDARAAAQLFGDVLFDQPAPSDSAGREPAITARGGRA